MHSPTGEGSGSSPLGDERASRDDNGGRRAGNPRHPSGIGCVVFNGQAYLPLKEQGEGSNPSAPTKFRY